jgi:glutathione S-transferase
MSDMRPTFAASDDIVLYHAEFTRSERVRWTLLELGLPAHLADDADGFGSASHRAAHPLVKVPALVDRGRPLFESAAICNWLADSHPEAGLGWQAGTWERALHDQWVAFTLAELEANLWHTARNKYLYTEAERVPHVYRQNAKEAARALQVLDATLGESIWLVGGRFSLTDIFVGLAVCWAAWDDLTSGLDRLEEYRLRLLARPNCTYGKADRRNPVTAFPD